jgi:SAM-dependent methyltransferase
MRVSRDAGAGVDLSPSSEYWDQVVDLWAPTLLHRLWRAHNDAVNIRLVRRWLPSRSGTVLKTDLFDEAVGRGIYPELAARSAKVCGIDLSPTVVRCARSRYAQFDTRVASVLELPFDSATFDVVFSNSTLDHFDSHRMLRAAVVELARTIRPGGKLLITLDNRANPIIALRTSALFAPMHKLGLIPYFVGATHGPRRLAKLLRETGFEVRAVTAIMHCPPQLAAAVAARRCSRHPKCESRHLSRVLRFEAMESWPTRALTGHFVAALAIKR